MSHMNVMPNVMPSAMPNVMPYAMPHMMMAHPPLLRTVQDCEATCEHMITILSRYPDVHMRSNQIILLRDCAMICATTAAYLARRSPFVKAIVNLCACICEVCGNECARFPDQHSQHCSRVCLHCAQECRAFVMSA